MMMITAYSRLRRILPLLAYLITGCQQSASVSCADGGICAAGTRCAMVGETPLCVTPTCGNGQLDPGEACDDGNNISGDGCPADCSEACGDAIVDPGEACDDGNAVDGDGCDHNCTPTGCGNGVVTSGEVCDDGNAVEGDGCDSNCTPTGCGNGVVTPGEACDDGNASNDDGCDHGCVMSCFLEKPTFSFTPSSALTVVPGVPATIDIAFTNHNSATCAPVDFGVVGTFFQQPKADALRLDPFSIAGVFTDLISSGTTAHMHVRVEVVGPVDPGAQFVVVFLISGESQHSVGGLASGQIAITIGASPLSPPTE